ncbi:MAG TPA: toll/interleukin-1 receptor domain-containing protein [Puia sp.]|nr:toll/interleukin-1 receptor domain-containing protein [Puia sp.]
MEPTVTNIRSAIFQDILSDIENESCVLIIGPDLVDFGEKSFFEILCDELQKDAQYSQLIDLTPQYVFLHEELLQLKPAARETTLLRYMERFYQRQSQYDEPFRKISQIPFHLVVSFLPDTRLKKIYKEQNLDFQYSHYPREESPAPVDKPTKKAPLLYNILGDFSEGDVIITFDHLFLYLSGIMGKRELPHAIQEAFKKARTFLFLGVHFERWYVQLILRIITTKEKKEKYSILKKGSGSEVYTFMARRLELDFLEIEPIDFLNQLHEACGANNMLKSGNKAIAAKVFISYSHVDKLMASKIGKGLKQKNIDVVIDEEAMPAGQKIDEFIDTIRHVDGVLAIISRDSLLSPWVTKEIITTWQKTDKYLLPCYLDESFLEKDFVDVAGKYVDEKIAAINEGITQRGRGSTDDLFTERNRWIEYFNSLPFVLNELNRRKCISLKNEDFELNFSKVADNILNNK